MKSRKVIIVSNEPWGDIWYSKQHYANELSKIGFEVFFLNPTGKWKLSNLFSWRLKEQKVNNDLTVIEYENQFPIRILKKLFTYLNDFFNFRKLRPKAGANDEVFFWQFDFLRFVYFPGKTDWKRIYHVVDPYMGYWQDTILSKKSDLIVSTNSRNLLYYKEHYSSKRSIHIPHGVASEEKTINSSVVESIKETHGDFLLLIGTINDDMDFGLLRTLLESHKTLIVGKSYLQDGDNQSKWESLQSLQNLNYVGVVHAQQLGEYVAASKAGLMIYKSLSPQEKGFRTPLKTLNYLAQYKPVISMIDCDIAELNGSSIFVAEDEQQFMHYCDEAMNGRLEINNELVRTYLSNYTYLRLIEKILSEVEISIND